jgi:tRNA (guanine-N7-)-methyltransferase
MEDMEKECKNLQNNRLIRSFGRIKSRRFSDHKDFLLANFLPIYAIENFDFTQINSQKTSLEIGFGFGDFTFEKAKQNPDILFFGAEPHLNGVVNLLAKLEQEPLPNLKISNQDVRLLLQQFAANFFEQIFILFPDPWPKLKHFKRRLITAEFLDEVLSPKMKNGAKLTIATDHDSYKTWILSEVSRSKKFSWMANSKKDWQNFPQDWVMTKYQKKALNEGRVPVIFNLIHNG